VCSGDDCANVALLAEFEYLDIGIPEDVFSVSLRLAWGPEDSWVAGWEANVDVKRDHVVGHYVCESLHENGVSRVGSSGGADVAAVILTEVD